MFSNKLPIVVHILGDKPEVDSEVVWLGYTLLILWHEREGEKGVSRTSLCITLVGMAVLVDHLWVEEEWRYQVTFWGFLNTPK